MITIAFNRKISDLLKSYTESTGETMYTVITQSLLDYVNILSHTCGKKPNKELCNIVNSFEMKIQAIFKRISEVREEFLKRRKEEAILLNKKLPHCDNKNYIMIAVPDELYNGIATLIRHYPHVFSKKKKAMIKDVVNRAVLFRIMENEELMKNEIYTAWRFEMLMRKEQEAKLSMNEILEIVSRKRDITLK